ncbi:MAG: signal peptide peptidase SppA [Pirellulaceae bacterium]|nr:signal peptide peptidase SppA [Pirellulaceae bacterium]
MDEKRTQAAPVAQPVHGGPQPGYYQPPKPSFFSRLLSKISWIGFAFCAFSLIGLSIAFSDYFDKTGGIQEKHYAGGDYSTEKIAIISLEGMITSGEGFVKKQIERVRKDKNIKAIVLRVDSPGGTVSGSDFIYHHLKKLKEEKGVPVVVSMGSMAASGGYYVSMVVGDQQEAIFAEPTTITGSIGVIIPHYDISGLMKKLEIKDDSIKSHPRKQILSMTQEMPEDHRQLIQAYIDESLVDFKNIVKAGRPAFREGGAVEGKTLDDLATGEIFSSKMALKYGLVDKIGYLEDAVDRAAELANVNVSDVRVVRFEGPPSIFGVMGMAEPSYPTEANSQTMLELATPKAYYMFTMAPLWLDSFKTVDLLAK